MGRSITVPGIATTVMPLGFGCASLGSRIGARDGMRVLIRAFDSGVTWFDVAPSYGNGLAEEILGKFLLGRRDSVQICTKVGIAPRRIHPLARAMRPIARSAVRLAPGIRTVISRRVSTAEHVSLTASLIHEGLKDSLRRLQTRQIDVLALHEPNVEDVARDDVLRALSDILQIGDASAIGIAGSAEAAAAALDAGAPISIVQLANNPFQPDATQFKLSSRHGDSLTYVTHSVFSGEGALKNLSSILDRDEKARHCLAQMGYHGTNIRIAADALMDYALFSNWRGVVLASMFKKTHLRDNLACAKHDRNPDLLRLLDELCSPARTRAK